MSGRKSLDAKIEVFGVLQGTKLRREIPASLRREIPASQLLIFRGKISQNEILRRGVPATLRRGVPATLRRGQKKPRPGDLRREIPATLRREIPASQVLIFRGKMSQNEILRREVPATLRRGVPATLDGKIEVVFQVLGFSHAALSAQRPLQGS